MNPPSDIVASWEKFLNPESLKQNLLQCGLYLAAFEMLKDSLVGRPRDFFSREIVADESPASPEYEQRVLALHKHAYTASALWWRNQGAISDDDLETLSRIREHRDKIAHNMPKIISTAAHNIDLDLLKAINALLGKIDNWWIQNIEAATDPDRYSQFSEEEMAEAGSISFIFLSMMIPLVSGDDSQFRTLYSMWCGQKTRKQG